MAIFARFYEKITVIDWSLIALVLAVVAGLIYKIIKIETYIEKLNNDQNQKNIIPIQNQNEHFKNLLFFLENSKYHAYLMFLNDNPPSDDNSLFYWSRFPDILIEKGRSVDFKRIITITTPQKLKFTLESNKKIFLKIEGKRIKIQYVLYYHPYKQYEPLHMDIIDEKVTFFSPYSDERQNLKSQKIFTENTDMEYQSRRYYLDLSKHLPILLDLNKEENTGYSDEEIKNYIDIFKKLNITERGKVEEYFTEYFKDFCHLDFNSFYEQFGG